MTGLMVGDRLAEGNISDFISNISDQREGERPTEVKD